jgi:hypothetical protein
MSKLDKHGIVFKYLSIKAFSSPHLFLYIRLNSIQEPFAQTDRPARILARKEATFASR